MAARTRDPEATETADLSITQLACDRSGPRAYTSIYTPEYLFLKEGRALDIVILSAWSIRRRGRTVAVNTITHEAYAITPAKGSSVL